MTRLPPLDPGSAHPSIREALNTLPPLNIFRTLAHAPTAFDPVVVLGGAILSQLELDPRLRELAVLQVARDCACEYEWVQHIEVARHVGVTEEQIAAVHEGEIADPARLGELDRAILQFTREVVLQTRVGDETFRAVAEPLGRRQTVELLLTIGDYLMIARLMTTLEMDVDESVGPAVTDATRRLYEERAASD
jgi:4-carboxymuconolactone decarboxylase